MNEFIHDVCQGASAELIARLCDCVLLCLPPCQEHGLAKRLESINYLEQTGGCEAAVPDCARQEAATQERRRRKAASIMIARGSVQKRCTATSKDVHARLCAGGLNCLRNELLAELKAMVVLNGTQQDALEDAALAGEGEASLPEALPTAQSRTCAAVAVPLVALQVSYRNNCMVPAFCSPPRMHVASTWRPLQRWMRRQRRHTGCVGSWRLRSWRLLTSSQTH